MDTPKDNNFDPDTLLVLFQEYEARIRSHRETLWQQVQHFSWLIIIIITAVAYLIAKPTEFESLNLAIPLLLIAGAGISKLAYRVIRQEREEFLRAVLVTRKVEKALGLHESINARELPNKDGLSGYLFRLDHINVFKIAEKLRLKNEKTLESEQLWINWRIGEKTAPFDSYSNIFRLVSYIFRGLSFVAVCYLWIYPACLFAISFIK